MLFFSNNFLKEDESGATAIEYALLASLISIGMITGALSLGKVLSNQFNVLSNKISGSAMLASKDDSANAVNNSPITSSSKKNTKSISSKGKSSKGIKTLGGSNRH
ncbi:Flp family type IVb pilin [Liberibacter sp. Z1]|nr:Flp family type IVb pilin [Candidatus Liberibacter sp.]